MHRNMKRFYIYFFFLLGICSFTDATDCLAVTDETCKETDHVTSKCSSEKCSCEDGYVPADSGCIKEYTPTASLSGGLSGEAVATSSVTLSCSPSTLGDGNYIWTESGTKLAEDDQKNAALTIDNIQASQTYTCQGNVNGYESPVSNTVQVTLVAADGDVNLKPIVLGMFEKSLEGQDMTLTCSNIPAVPADLTYEWYEDAIEDANKMDSSTNTQSVTLETDDTSKKFFCKIIKPDGATYNIVNGESDAVTGPATLSTDIQGVKITEASPITAFVGGTLTLNCEISDGPTFNPAGVTYKWYTVEESVDTAITDEIDKQLSLANLDSSDQKSYKCSGKAGTEAEKKSEAVAVTVNEPDGTAIAIIAEPTGTPLEKGCLYLRCDLKHPSYTGITFEWKVGDAVIFNHEDRYVQYCPAPEAQGVYKCAAKSTGSSIESTGKTIAAALDIEDATQTPTLTSDLGVGEEYGQGSTHVFTCSATAFESPGLTYTWTFGGDAQSETGNTLSVTLGTVDTSVACKAKFDDKTSAEDKIEIEAADIKKITKVDMVVDALSSIGNTLPATITPKVASEITFKCDVSTGASVTESIVYKWYSAADTAIDGATSMTYKYTAVASTNVALQCEGKIGDEDAVKSASLAIEPSDTFGDPTAIAVLTGGAEQDKLSAGATYMFYCNTPFYSDSVTFKWEIDSSVESTTKAYLEISTLKEKDETQELKCSTTEGSDTTSVTLDLTVGAEGKHCDYVTDCEGEEFAGDCTESRCVCTKGYSLDGATCSKSSSAALVMSGLLLVVSFAVTKLF